MAAHRRAPVELFPAAGMKQIGKIFVVEIDSISGTAEIGHDL